MSNMTFTDCRFEENTAGYSGGAMRVDSASALTVRNSVFLNNTAVSDRYNGGGDGGAIYVWGGTPQVEFHSCDFRLNTAADSGGGGGGVKHDAGGSLLVDGSTFKNNWAKYSGGGISATGGVEQVYHIPYIIYHISYILILERSELLILCGHVNELQGRRHRSRGGPTGRAYITHFNFERTELLIYTAA